jgi:ribosomal protein S13
MTDDPVAAKIKVSTLLESLPGYGKAKVAKLMDELKIDPSRRVKGLGEIQRKALIDFFNE